LSTEVYNILKGCNYAYSLLQSVNQLSVTLLDARGEPITCAKSVSTEVPNSDLEFFFGGMAGGGGGTITAEAIKSKPYLNHIWIYSCAKIISLNISRLVPILYEKENSENTLNDHPILTLLEKPNEIMTATPFWQMVVLNLLVNGGECFLVPWNEMTGDAVDLSKGEVPTQLYPYSNKFISPKFTKGTTKTIEVWEFKAPGSVTALKTFRPDQIIHIYFVDPYDWYKAASPLVASQVAIDQDVKADIYNTRLFSNDARPSGILSTDQPLTANQAEQTKKQWNSQYGGVGNVGKIAVVGAGLKFNPIGFTQAEMQYIEQKDKARDQIISAFGLNKIATGNYEQINFATIKEGRKIPWYDTYIPIADQIIEAINAYWIRNIDQGKYRIKFDYSKVESLQQDYKDKATTAGVLVTSVGLPPSLACRITGIPLSTADIAKYPYLDARLIPVAVNANTEVNTPAKSIKVAETPIIRSTEDERLKKSDEYIEKVLIPIERSMIRDLKRHFFSQRNSVLDKIDSWAVRNKGILVEKAYSISIDSLLFNIDEEVNTLMKLYRPNAADQMRLEAKAIEKELGHSIDWNVTDPRIDKFTKARVPQMKDLETNTYNVAHDVIGDTVKEGLKENWTNAELAKHLKENVHAVYEVRTGNPITVSHPYFDLGGMSSSKTIARTEMGIIASEARFEAFKEEGITKWEWVTSRDEKVRETHIELDGQEENIGAEFDNGLRFPRDTASDDPGEICNCRCVTLAVIE